MDIEKDGACKMDRQNKKCSCMLERVGRRKNNAGSDKEEEKKLAGPLAKKDALEQRFPNLFNAVPLSQD